LIAYPADYSASGIMTFIVNQNGVVWQRDLGRTRQQKLRRWSSSIRIRSGRQFLRRVDDEFRGQTTRTPNSLREFGVRVV
jgi:hypothetical protein